VFEAHFLFFFFLFKIFANEVSNLKLINGEPPYLILACEVDGQKRQTRVLVSKHSGYIFIQTDQPIYNPTQKGNKNIVCLTNQPKVTKVKLYQNSN